MLQHVLEACGDPHDLDWLQDSPLTGLDAVRERANPLAPMPEAQALRAGCSWLRRSALPAMPGTYRFRRRCTCSSRASVEAKRVTEIAGELGVSREWCSRLILRSGPTPGAAIKWSMHPPSRRR